ERDDRARRADDGRPRRQRRRRVTALVRLLRVTARVDAVVERAHRAGVEVAGAAALAPALGEEEGVLVLAAASALAGLPAGRAAARPQVGLPEADVVPLLVLPADLAEAADVGEAGPLEQGDARRVGQRDAGDGDVEAARDQLLEQRGEERAAEPLAAAVGRQV